MKHRRMMMLAILLTFVGSILADNLMVSNIELKADETQNVTINLNNSSKNYVAFQFDVVLPEGITIAKNDSGKLIASLNSDRIDDHSLNVQDLGSGSYRFLCFSMTNAEFYGTSGPLVNITLQADGNISAGKKEGVIKAQVFTETNGNQVKWDDMPFSMTIPDEGSSVVSNLIVSDIELKVGRTQEMAINLNNGTKKYVAFQFDVALPEGITIAKNEKGKLIASLNTDRIDDHTLNVQDLGSGNYRFLCFSMTNAEFYGTSGLLVNLTLQASENLSSGERTATIRNQVFTEVSSDQVKWDDLSFKITTPVPIVPEITADNKSRLYGDENPVFTYTTNETLNGEPELATTATKTSPVGEYEIVVHKGTLKGDFIAKNGKLTITKAPLTITAKSYTMKQGDALPAFDVTYSGFKNNENKEVLTKQPTVSCEATSATVPGTYDIVVNNAEAGNYDISYIKGTLTIVEADPVKVTAKSYTREYGNDNPTFEYSVEGASLEGTPEIICEATATSPVGEYPIIIKKGSVKNYNDTYINGVLTITKAPLTISVGNYEKKQYDPMPEFMVSYEGFKNNETKDVLTKQPTVSCVANEDSAPGEYAIRVTGAESQNYEIQFVSGKLIVTDPPSYTLTYIVDGEEYKSFTVKYRDAIIPLAVPSKEGYTFSGWSEIPATMPAKDVVVTGTFSVNSYTLTYMVDGEVYKTSSVVYGTTITPEATPTKEGYTFSGWSEIPATMPEKNVVVTGSFTINKYKLTYIVGGVEYKSYEINYASAITPEAAPTKEGYTFSGWSEIPKNMPAKDVVVTGKFSINSYTMTYMVDGEVYKTSTIVYGTPITPEEEPEKKGYTFSGWSEVPATMPAMDVVIKGSFTINKYKLTYMVDGVEYKSYEINYSATITPEATPIKEGYTFSGWSEIPETMPANDVTVTGTFSINSYTLTYMVDGEVYKTSTVAYGTILTPETTPEKEGYTFSGWSEIPETMPANDVVVTGTFTVNSYIVRFMYRDEVLYTEEVNYGEPIPLPELYDDYGLLIKWLDVPETMPAHDIVILVDETDVVLNLQGEKKDDIKIYDLNGHRLASPQKGINIIRMSDGTSHKVLIK